MLCPQCGSTNKERANYCHSCGAYLKSSSAQADTSLAEINIPYPQTADLRLTIRVGACRLKLVSGSGGAWVLGRYYYPRGALPLKTESRGGRVTITQDYDVTGLGGLLRYTPRFELALGRLRPYSLKLEAGASDVMADLGGVPLKGLVIRQGAGRADFNFSARNPEEMASIDVNSGAVSLQMKGLSNANFAEMTFDGGAASYSFDFGGRLARDAKVRITTSLAPVTIHIPSATAASVAENTVAAALDLGDGFTRKGGAFLTEAAVKGSKPVLTIVANVSLGTLSLRSTG